jgi:hypothetical protein
MGTHLLDTFHMMDAAVINDENALQGRIQIHDLKKAFEPNHELVAIVAANFDVAIDNSFSCYRGKH